MSTAEPHIRIVVAYADNRVIGRDNQLPWRLSGDLKHFRQTTMGHPIIMGRKTWESLGRALPGRHNIVVTRNRTYVAEGATVVASLDEALRAADAHTVCVIGGAQLYAQALARATEIIATEVHAEVAGDAFFPALAAGAWREASRAPQAAENGLAYDFVVYQRAQRLPLEGVRVVEFTHMVMGPTCGMVLADLGAEVIKVEPAEGDRTRHLLGAGSGFFPLFNRNKKSIGIDLRKPQGAAVARALADSADVVLENFRPGTMEKYGLDYAQLSARNPRVVYVSLKGFLPGPYAHRTALDEVVQMMGGLAYMTGRRGDPLRAGSSVNDIMGGMFGAIGALAALMERQTTGRGQEVQSALFENNVFLVAQHMLQYAITGQAAAPMPERISAWGVYDVFTVKDGEQIFLAAVSDAQWQTLCNAFGFDDLKADASLASNNDRVRARARLVPELGARLRCYSAAELARIFEDQGLPFAPIAKPEDLFDDPHLRATGGLADMVLPDGERAGEVAQTTLFPFTLGGERLGVRLQPPTFGRDTDEVLRALAYTPDAIQTLRAQGVVA